MASTNSTDLPGVSISEHPLAVCYMGSDAALLGAGIVKQEWIADLGGYTRVITLEDDSGFSVIRDGNTSQKGHVISNERRNKGLISFLRLRSGELKVLKYLTIEEKRNRDKARNEERPKQQARMEREDDEGQEHELALNPYYQGAIGILNAGSANEALERVREFAFPGRGVKYTEESEARILRLISELRQAFAEGCLMPSAPKYRTDGNVIHFPSIAENGHAH